jgi:hypothetical protein
MFQKFPQRCAAQRTARPQHRARPDVPRANPPQHALLGRAVIVFVPPITGAQSKRAALLGCVVAEGG